MEGVVRYYKGTKFVDQEKMICTSDGGLFCPRKGDVIIFHGFEYRVVDVFWRLNEGTVTVYASMDAERFDYGDNPNAGRVEETPGEGSL